MRVKYFADQFEAAGEYRALIDVGVDCILCGPDSEVIIESVGPGNLCYDKGYVLLSECTSAIASFKVSKKLGDN